MGINALRDSYKYPSKKPNLDVSVYPKWFNSRHDEFFRQLIPSDVSTIVELGSWVGFSTRWFAENTDCPDIVCIDTWAGSAEHSDFTQEQLDNLFKAFTQSCWAHRNKIIPLQMNTVQGMLKLKEYNVCKDVEIVYVDASHQYEDVIVDIEMAWEIFPNATLIGDDFTWKNPTQNRRRTVCEAVNYFCDKKKIQFVNSRTSYLWAIRRE